MPHLESKTDNDSKCQLVYKSHKKTKRAESALLVYISIPYNI